MEAPHQMAALLREAKQRQAQQRATVEEEGGRPVLLQIGLHPALLPGAGTPPEVLRFHPRRLARQHHLHRPLHAIPLEHRAKIGCSVTTCSQAWA